MKKITFVKQLAFFIALFCAVNFGFGQTTLSPGDIVITGFNSGSPHQLTFVLLKDVSNTTQINFTDNGWNLSTGLRDTEGTLTWQANSNLPCGTEIFLERVTNSNLTASHGTLTASNSFVLNSTSDQILAYQGPISSPSFIYAIHYGPGNWSNAIDAATTAIPSGLTDGVNAVYLGNFTFGNYTCTVTSNQSLILAAVSTATNWFRPNTRIAALGGCAYTCVPCPTTVTWNGSVWSNGTGPTLSLGAELNGNYDTSINVSFSACSLTIANNATLNVADNTFVEVQNNITVNTGSTFQVQPYGAVVQIDNSGTVTNNGTMSVTKKTAPMAVALEYTYWSSPVFGETIGNGLFEADASRRYSFNALNFLDATAETGNDGATVPGQDDIDDNGDDWQWVSAATLMEPGVGYASTHDPSVFIFPGPYDYSFEGRFNTGIINVPVYRNDGSTADNNWNFIGNPYPSAITASAFFTQNNYNATTNTAGTLAGAIYYWSQNTPPSGAANGNQAYNFATSDYATYNGTLGVAGGDGVMPTGFIPSGQGFFISYSQARPSSTGTVVFNNAMRVKGSTDNSQFFKNTNTKGKTNSSVENKIWVNLTSDNGVFNQTGVGYVAGATNNDDDMFYDAPKNLSSGTAAHLYTTIEGSNKKFVIQGKDVNSINEDEVINLGFKTTINVATLYKLSIAQLEGDFLTNNSIFLVDHLLNKMHDLSVCDYTFTSEVGEFNSRFEIAFTNKALSVTDVQLNTKAFKIVELQDDLVQFNTNNNLTIKTVNIYDLLGRELYRFKGENTSETYRLSNLNNTVYIAKVALSDGTVVTKKAVKK